MHSLSCIASSDTDPDTPHRAQRVAVLSRIPSASSGITEISHICAYSECGIRTRLRKAMDPSAGTVSLKSQTSVLCSISDCLLIFFIFFFSSRELETPAAISGRAELLPSLRISSPLGFRPPMCEHSRVLWCSLCTHLNS